MARPASDIRERILEAASTLFAQVGVDGTSLRAIAREAGTSVGMIAYHFENKDGLFRAVVERVYDPFLSDLEAVAAAEPEALPRLVALLRRVANPGDEERRAVRTLLREASIESPRIPYVVARFVTGHVRLIVAALVQAHAEGRIRDLSPLGLVPILLAPVVVPQMLRAAIKPLLGDAFDGVFERGIDVLLYGLVPR